MAVRRICYILALAGCIGFYIAYQKWFAWIVLLAMLLLPWFSLILSLRAMLCLKLKLTVPERIRQGTKAFARLELRCPGVRPPFRCRIIITKPNTGESWFLSAGDGLPTDHCGGLTVKLERARVYDYLGLFRIRLRKTPVCIARVMPDVKEMPIPEEMTRVLARAWKPKAGGGYAENHEIRQYRPGDTLNLVHWKLSAKMDSLMLREPMEPDGCLMILSMDLCGTPDELDRKLGRFLWLGNYLLSQDVSFAAAFLTANGLESWSIDSESDLNACMEEIVCTPLSPEGSLRELNVPHAWQYHIGGEPDEG